MPAGVAARARAEEIPSPPCPLMDNLARFRHHQPHRRIPWGIPVKHRKSRPVVEHATPPGIWGSGAETTVADDARADSAPLLEIFLLIAAKEG